MARFTYFGYASNLTEYKVGMRCRSVAMEGIGRLDNFTIEFRGCSSDWLGGSATLRPKQGSVVWGVIWTIDETEKAILDEQEGVLTGMYRHSTVDVVDETGQSETCRVYEQVDKTDKLSSPSPQYLAVIIEGAVSRQLPKEYVEKLKNTPTNGNTAMTQMMEEVLKRRNDVGFPRKLF